MPQLHTSAWGEDSAGRTVQQPFHFRPKHRWLRPTFFTRLLASGVNNRAILYRPLPPAANAVNKYHISYHISLYRCYTPALTACFKFLNETNTSNSATFFRPRLRLTSRASGGHSSLTFWRLNYFFKILAHSVYKTWIKQESNTLELWNKLHFEEKRTESIYHV